MHAGPVLTGLLICAGAGAALGLAGCRRRGARAWAVHACMAAATLAMLLPALDPFGGGGRLVWVVALACLAIWTACARPASELTAGPDAPGIADAHRPIEAHRPARVRELLDLWAMAFIVLLMPGMHGSPGTEASAAWTNHVAGSGPTGGHHSAILGSVLGAPPAGHVPAGGGAHDVRVAVLLLVVLWLGALAWLQVRAHRGGRRSPVAGAGSLFSALAMAGMVLA
jgi:hypothetical protein